MKSHMMTTAKKLKCSHIYSAFILLMFIYRKNQKDFFRESLKKYAFLNENQALYCENLKFLMFSLKIAKISPKIKAVYA